MPRANPKTGLTPPQEVFAIECAKPAVTQADAYRTAYPKSRNWRSKTVIARASRVANWPHVAKRIRELRELAVQNSVMDVPEALRRLSHMGRADLRKCYHPDGRMKLPHEMDDVTAAALMGMETVEQQTGKNTVVRGHKVKLIKPTEAIQKLLEYHHRSRWLYDRTPAIEGEAKTVPEGDEVLNNDAARRIAFVLLEAGRLKAAETTNQKKDEKEKA